MFVKRSQNNHISIAKTLQSSPIIRRLCSFCPKLLLISRQMFASCSHTNFFTQRTVCDKFAAQNSPIFGSLKFCRFPTVALFTFHSIKMTPANFKSRSGRIFVVEHKLPREPNYYFSGELPWPGVKGSPTEIIATYIQEHNLGG